MITLDTHALVWWVSAPKRIPAKSRKAIELLVGSGGAVTVSSISIWEIAMLVARGRLTLTLPTDVWLSSVEALPFVQFIPVDNRIAMRAVALEKFPHRDPADRIIAATALGLGATLITADAGLQGYSPVRTIWG